MWYLAEAIDDFDLIDRVYRWRKAAVDTEDLVVDDDTQCEEIKHVRKIMPDICVSVFPRALGVEAVRLCDSARLMVAANQMDAIRVSQLQAYKQRNCLDAEKAAIDIIPCHWRQPHST